MVVGGTGLAMTWRARGTKGLVWLAVPAIAMASLAGWAFGPRQADATTANAAVAYGFDEGSGSAVSDASPNGRTGSVVSATWTASGRFGAALSFNGSSSRVVTTSSLPVGTSFSLTAWVYDSAGSGYHTIAAAGQARDIYLLDGELWIYGGAGDIDLGVAVPTGRWVHVAVTSDGTTLRGYVDGVAGPATAANLTTSAAAPLQIGAWPSNGANYDFFNGRIDEVRWYTRAVTAGEISADSSTPVSGAAPRHRPRRPCRRRRRRPCHRLRRRSHRRRQPLRLRAAGAARCASSPTAATASTAFASP